MNADISSSSDPDDKNGNDASIGSLLRASRNRRNEDLSEVSSALRIRQVYLEAIEGNRFDDLPGAIYAIGFIRTYSDYLGLDGEEIVRRYKTEANAPASKQELSFPSLVPEHGIPGGAIVLLGLVLAAIGYGSWYFVSTKNIFATEEVPAVPEKLASVVGEKPVAPEMPTPVETPPETAQVEAAPKSAEKAVENTVAVAEEKLSTANEAVNTEPTTSVSENKAEATETATTIKPADPTEEPKVDPEPEPAPSPAQEVVNAVETKVEETKEPVVETKLIEAEPASAPTPKAEPETEPQTVSLPETAATEPTPPAAEIKPETPAPAEPAKTSRITLRALTDSYIQVRDNTADQLILTRLLKTGESYQVPNRTGLSLVTGNAGALEILVDGTLVPSLGPVGAVRRNVALEAEKLINGSAIVE